MKSDAQASPAGQLFRTRRHESEADAGIETDVPGVLVIRDVLAIKREGEP